MNGTLGSLGTLGVLCALALGAVLLFRFYRATLHEMSASPEGAMALMSTAALSGGAIYNPIGKYGAGPDVGNESDVGGP